MDENDFIILRSPMNFFYIRAFYLQFRLRLPSMHEARRET